MTGSELQENYYRIKFANVGYEVYEYGQTAKAAIWTALDDLIDGGHPEPLGAATARPAVYKEWNYGTEHYTNGGDFIRDTRKPCRNCATPVNFHTYKEELGYCQPCQADFFNHTCDKCGEDNVNNWDGNPFTRYCDECEGAA